MGRKVIRNAAKCLGCGVTVESRHRHDFRTCDCGNLSVDGGHAYLRTVVTRPELMEDMSIVEEEGPSIEEQNDDWTTSDLFEEKAA